MNSTPSRRSAAMASRALGALLAAALFAPACAPSLNLRSDYSPETDFTKLRTFAWLPVTATTGDPRADSPILAGRIRRAAVDDLKSKGYREVAPDQNPDFYVTYQAAIQDRVKVQSSPSYVGGYGWAGYGYRGWAGGRWGGPVGYVGTETTVRQYEQGTLVIDIVDRERDDLIWRGSAQAKLKRDDNRSSAERDEAARDVVRQILKSFPPGAA